MKYYALAANPLLKIILVPVIAMNLQAGLAQKPYFQQEVHYRITASLDDVQHRLSGAIEIRYINHSPDTLREIYMHLWPNAYQRRNTAFGRQQLEAGNTRFYFAKDSELGGLSNLDFKANNQAVEWRYEPEHPDIAIIRLPAPLLPEGEFTIGTPFVLQFPASFSRLGHVGQSYQATQWYPKPAVYDKDGWHHMPYLDMGEFYSEFGSFDVSLTLPENYVVGATGELQTESERDFLERRVAETRVMMDSFTADHADRDTFPISSKNAKTIRFLAENVHDFAWFADKRFRVQRGEVEMPSGRKIDTWVMFTRTEEQLWKNAISYVNRAVQFYSELVGEYPWPQATAVQSALSAGGGMEYPMITVISTSGNASSLDEVITHEVGHNWFYGIIASNERDHAWLDEGVNTYYEERYMRKYYGDGGEFSGLPRFVTGGSAYDLGELAYLYQCRRRIDQAPETSSADLSRVNYFLGAYAKPAAALRYLESYLGAQRFDEAMRDYYRKWQFKHPQPADFRAHWELATGRKLDWLFDGLLFSNKRMDYKLVGAHAKGDSILVKIKNAGRIAGPIQLTAVKDKDSLAVFSQWLEGFEGTATVVLPGSDFRQIMLDRDRITLDFYRKNNQMRRTGLLRKVEPLSLRLVPGPENDRRTDLFLFPALTWNHYDKTMLGLVFFNHSVLSRRFEWELAPMYAIGSRTISGVGRAMYHFYPAGHIVHKVTLGAGLRHFRYNSNDRFDYQLGYLRATPFVRLELGKSPASHFYQNLTWRTIVLNREEAQFNLMGNYTGKEWFTDYVHELSYNGENRGALYPYRYRVALERQRYKDVSGSQRYLKASFEWAGRLTYAPRRGLHIRCFVGGFLDNTRRNAGAFYPGAFNLVSQGYNDYRFDDYYFGRNEPEGIWSQQISIRDGGMKNVIGQGFGLGRSNSFIAALNFKADLWRKLPVKPYFDIGYFDNAQPTGRDDTFSDQLMWSGGLMVEWLGGAVGLYFPLLNSQNIQDRYAERGNYWSRIAFHIDLQQLDPWRFVEGIQF